MAKKYTRDEKSDREVKEVLWELAEKKLSKYRNLREEIYNPPKKSIFSGPAENSRKGKKYSPPPPEYKEGSKFVFR